MTRRYFWAVAAGTVLGASAMAAAAAALWWVAFLIVYLFALMTELGLVP